MSDRVQLALRELAAAVHEEGGELLEVVVNRSAWHRVVTNVVAGSQTYTAHGTNGVMTPRGEPNREGALVAVMTPVAGFGPFRFVGIRKM